MKSAGVPTLDDSLLTRLTKTIFPERRTVSDLYSALAVSHADSFPDVPPPENSLSPSILAARWLSHDLYGEDMPAIAADLLERGFDSPSLRRLAGEMRITHSADVDPLVGATFRELGGTWPASEKDAKLIASRQLLVRSFMACAIHGRRRVILKL
jgi:hypothetical protein